MRPGRIELPPQPWQGRVLPLNYGRIVLLTPNNGRITNNCLHLKLPIMARSQVTKSRIGFASLRLSTRDPTSRSRLFVGTSLRLAQVQKTLCLFSLARPAGFGHNSHFVRSRPHLAVANATCSGLRILTEAHKWASSDRCAPGRIRTHNPLVRSQVLYPLSYGRVQKYYDKSRVFPKRCKNSDRIKR